MNKHKKITITLLIVYLLNITCFANYSDYQIQKDVEFVESLDLFSCSSESYVTRSTMLNTFVNIVDNNYEKYDFSDNKFADIREENSDFKVASFALNYGLFTGKYYENGKIVADLDSYATWQEVLMVSLRSLNISFNAHNDEELLFWLQYLSLDEFSVKSNNEFLKIGDILDERVGYNEYCCFINRVLHTPYTIYAYGGELTKYHIDKFVFCQ